MLNKELGTIEEVKSKIFYYSAAFVIIGELLDIIIGNHLIFVELAAYFMIGLTIVVILLRATKILNNAWANSIILYSLVFDVLSTLYLLKGTDDFSSYFIRVSILLVAIIPYAGFNINKYHSIIVGVLVFFSYIVLSFLAGDEILIRAIPVIFIIEFAYVLGIYFLIHSLILIYSAKEELLTKTELANNALIERKKELKEAIESKNSLFSIISHDLKNPFNGLIGFISLLEKALEKNDIEKVKKYLSMIKSSSRNAYFLIINLFDWASTQKETSNFAPIKLNFRELVNEVLELAKIEAERKKIKIENQVNNEHIIFADKNMMASVIRNLISNAIKFTPENGHITIGIIKEGNADIYFVRDSGIGTTDEKLKTMFSSKPIKSEPGTMNETGSGLGLSICKDFIDKHQGKIWAEKNIDAGITVYFTIQV